ncbi:MAG: hypothetical protein JKY23_00430 [Nitrospinaceae bacterium]|nr:hypothetical protein [Nitrospinaceae bacterium]
MSFHLDGSKPIDRSLALTLINHVMGLSDLSKSLCVDGATDDDLPAEDLTWRLIIMGLNNMASMLAQIGIGTVFPSQMQPRWSTPELSSSSSSPEGSVSEHL